MRGPSVCAETLVSFCGWCLFKFGSEEVSVCQRDECRLNVVVCSCAMVVIPRASVHRCVKLPKRWSVTQARSRAMQVARNLGNVTPKWKRRRPHTNQ